MNLSPYAFMPVILDRFAPTEFPDRESKPGGSRAVANVRLSAPLSLSLSSLSLPARGRHPLSLGPRARTVKSRARRVINAPTHDTDTRGHASVVPSQRDRARDHRRCRFPSPTRSLLTPPVLCCLVPSSLILPPARRLLGHVGLDARQCIAEIIVSLYNESFPAAT